MLGGDTKGSPHLISNRSAERKLKKPDFTRLLCTTLNMNKNKVTPLVRAHLCFLLGWSLWESCCTDEILGERERMGEGGERRRSQSWAVECLRTSFESLPSFSFDEIRTILFFSFHGRAKYITYFFFSSSSSCLSYSSSSLSLSNRTVPFLSLFPL